MRRGIKQQLKKKIDKYRKARNKQKKDEPPLPMVKLDQIPDDCADDCRLPAEAIVFMHFHDHPVFNLNVNKKGQKKRAKKGGEEKGEDGDCSIQPEEIRSFSSRKKQREDHKKHWKDGRTYNKNELAVQKLLVAEKQADAMTRQVDLQAQKVKLDFLIKAGSVGGLSSTDLRPMFLQALKRLYSEDKEDVEDKKMPASKFKTEEAIEIDLDEDEKPKSKEDIYKKYDQNRKGFDWEEYDGFSEEFKKPWVYTCDMDLVRCFPADYRFAAEEDIGRLKEEALREREANKDFSQYTKDEFEEFGLPEGSWKGRSYVHFGMCCAGGHCKMSDRIVDTRFKCGKCGQYAHEDCFDFVAFEGGSMTKCIRCIKEDGKTNK